MHLELASFKKSIKREASAYSVSKDERYFDKFQRDLFIEYMHSQNTKFGDSLVFHITSSIGPFYLSQTILERGESQLQIMSCGPKMISTL